MTTNKPGSVNQQPLYSCTNCYEDYTWTAGDLRVYDGECWCELCWDKRGWEFSDQLFWNDLEPYTPALQAECDALVEALERIMTWPDGGNRYGQANIKVFAAEALAACRKQGEGDV